MSLDGIDSESTVRIARDRPLCSSEFLEFCAANPEWRMEQEANGEIVIMPPAGGETGHRNFELNAEFAVWARRDGRGKGFDSSTGFKLPNGATRSPDLAWVSNQRLQQIERGQKSGFLPLCPEFVIELVSPSDSLPGLKRKMHEWIGNGAQLGWLIDPDARRVHVFRTGSPAQELTGVDRIEGEGPVAGFTLHLKEIWAEL